MFPGIQGGPLEHIIAAKAVAFREASQPQFVTYQRQVIANAQVLAKELVKRDFKLVSGGTDNHLILMDLSKNGTLTGKDYERALGKVNITVNKNTVPNEKRSPFVTSGIRIGTPAVTTRGFKEAEMHTIADLMDEVRQNHLHDKKLAETAEKVHALTSQFPIYPQWS